MLELRLRRVLRLMVLLLLLLVVLMRRRSTGRRREEGGRPGGSWWWATLHLVLHLYGGCASLIEVEGRRGKEVGRMALGMRVFERGGKEQQESALY
ncbi:hypothetical protein BDY24DRAFT_381719 [Mrakia frigida]|uniref:uncharacterized protein n=1 Tax=Mrakia frigida TaxID=29902 RepID=UPI003FCC0E7D